MSNRLADETSPYLLQHRDNPVDWHPWGDDARALARETDRPILLSIGYSSCHWCHVMERESFEDSATAELMNEGFVNVKVDREERPDVDAIYMRAVQSLTGHGGWPLTVFLTPDGLPFYGGTYFPPEPRHGMPSFRQVLEAVGRAWEKRRAEVEGAAGEIRGLIEQTMKGSEEGRAGDPEDAGEPRPRVGGKRLPAEAVGVLLASYDPTHGGFGRAPKFPQPVVLDFLLRHHHFTGDEPALEAALHTLRRMGRGGVRDHLGGGFHRYSVDERWLVPHFEKMLYDNALLAGTYLRAAQLTGDPEFESVCRAVLDDLLDDFRSPDGGFYSARDADSEGEEGLFYLWTLAEVKAVLGDDAALFARCYGISEGGNFEGRNIPHLAVEPERVAAEEGLEREELEGRLARSRAALKEARSEREPPLLDTKVLAGWNGLTLRALAEAGAALDEPRYLEAARTGAAYLLEALRPEGRLLHQVPGSGVRIPAFLEDVTALGNALLSLHEATLEPRWLEAAVELAGEVEERFRDEADDLLFDTPADGEELVVRPREVMDNPTPSGNSLAAELYLRLGRHLDRKEWIDGAARLLAREEDRMLRHPSGFGRALGVATTLAHPSIEVAVVGDPGDPATRALLREVHRSYLPGAVISGGVPSELPFPTPLLSGRKPVDGAPAAYVCRDYACRAPVTQPQEVEGALGALGAS